MNIVNKYHIILKSKIQGLIKKETGDAGVGFILTIAAALIVSAFVFIPGLRSFGENVISAINSWWTTDIAPSIFPSS